MKTQELLLNRFAFTDNYTIGRLSVNGLYLCDTLEDKVRELDTDLAGPFYKVANETAIPRGRYRVIVNHSPSFGFPLPLLLNVPFFSGIRIHRGTHENHTSGCILVGENKAVGKVLNSIYWEEYLTKIIDEYKGETWITIE
jgi:hypothetical protein